MASLIEPRAAFMRYVGQGHEIVVPFAGARDLAAGDAASYCGEAFQREYVARCSHALFPMRRWRILTWSLTVSTEPERAAATATAPSLLSMCRWNTGAAVSSIWRPGVSWSSVQCGVPTLALGARLSGPAIIAEDETTTFVTAAFDWHRQRPRLHRPGAA